MKRKGLLCQACPLSSVPDYSRGHEANHRNLPLPDGDVRQLVSGGDAEPVDEDRHQVVAIVRG